jgi:hypothetical protein
MGGSASFPLKHNLMYMEIPKKFVLRCCVLHAEISRTYAVSICL